MDRKKEIKHSFKETSVEAGVFQIKNNLNNKLFIGSTRNLKTINGTKFMLRTNGFTTSKELQNEYNQYGKDAFTFEILEILKKSDNLYFNEKEALQEMEQKWLETLQPYGEQGYHQK